MRTPERHVARDGTSSWKVRYRDGGRQRSETFGTLAGAKEFARLLAALGPTAAIAHLDASLPRHRRGVTFGEWFDTYVTQLTGVTERTRFDYAALARRTFGPALFGLPLTDVDRAAVAAVVNDLDSRLSAKSIRNAHSLLSACLAEAVAQGKVSRNPAAGIRLPRASEHETRQVRFLDHDEFARLLAATPEHYRPLVLTLAGTGMRWSEATALQARDIDLRVPHARVVRAWKRVPGKGHELGPPKTRRSRRTVVLPAEVADALAPLVAGAPPERLVFATQRQLRPVSHSNFYGRVWKRACADAGLDPAPRVHDLRHSHVAWLIELDIRLPVIQDRLGHESITTTINTYGHLMPDLAAQAAQAASIALSPARPPD